jgi:electron transfer flavoprotein alpha subunit
MVAFNKTTKNKMKFTNQSEKDQAIVEAKRVLAAAQGVEAKEEAQEVLDKTVSATVTG